MMGMQTHAWCVVSAAAYCAVMAVQRPTTFGALVKPIRHFLKETGRALSVLWVAEVSLTTFCFSFV